MLRRQLLRTARLQRPSVCLFCAVRSPLHPSAPPLRFTWSATAPRWDEHKPVGVETVKESHDTATTEQEAKPAAKRRKKKAKAKKAKTKTETESGPETETNNEAVKTKKNRKTPGPPRIRRMQSSPRTTKAESAPKEDRTPSTTTKGRAKSKSSDDKPLSLKDAMLNTRPQKKKKKEAQIPFEELSPSDLEFTPIHVDIPPVPMLGYGLDRVLFNPGVYRLQDPRSRVFNFDPYLEKIMPVKDFNFDALGEYKTSSKDETLLALTKKLATKFTGSTSSMSGVLSHFHFVLSKFRDINTDMLSRGFPEPSKSFSKITLSPSAVFLRWKDGTYAIDADKEYDEPNIMSWLGHSLEKLLTSSRDEFELYRRSNDGEAPGEDKSARCYHYSKLGNFLMRSQLDAHDPRLPGSGVFDLKTRAVVSIRMDHKEFEVGAGYQLRYAQGEWESFEREFYDMTRATMLKYSLQVRMGRMDGIFVAYHNIERIFGFQYLSLSDMDNVLHGQTDTCLGDQEFRSSIYLLDELLQRATAKFPETSMRLHFESSKGEVPFMYIFAEPITEEQADAIQDAKKHMYREFERNIVGVTRDDPETQEEWQKIQERVDEEVNDDKKGVEVNETDELDNTDKKMEDDASDLTGQSSEAETGGPLMGWTLTIRNKVNGSYVERPQQLTQDDEWKVEYHIKELAPEVASAKYAKTKTKREKLLGQNEEVLARRLIQYRRRIREISEQGREWRNEQDKIAGEMGTQTYVPLGPGSVQAASA